MPSTRERKYAKASLSESGGSFKHATKEKGQKRHVKLKTLKHIKTVNSVNSVLFIFFINFRKL